MEGDNKEQVEALAKEFNLGAGLVANLLKSESGPRVNFLRTVQFSGLPRGEQKIGNMLYSLATKLPTTCERFRQPLAAWVGSGAIAHQSHLDVAIEYVKTRELKGGADLQDLRRDCGVGVLLSREEVLAAVGQGLAGADDKAKKVEFLVRLKGQLPSVEGKLLKQVFDEAWKARGLPQGTEKGEKKQKKEKKQEVKEVKEEPEEAFQIKDIAVLVGRQMKSSNNSKELVAERNAKFGDIVMTRFPPEPNGYLHIGHCKAMRFDFMLAKVHNGKCYLRYDDTNPTKENQEYIDNIIENVRFMGYQPWKKTHASDNFEFLHQCAVRLIQQGDAFVCSENSEESRKKRAEGLPSKDRDRPIEENLRLFEEMRLGLHEEGALSLRAKIDYKSANTTLRDPVIYRIKFHSHPHVGDQWCIYPLYDFAHPLCDSIEGITHSLCSLEFEIRRELYYWPLQRLNLYRAHQWQFSRLNITYTVLSKRKLHELVFKKHVDGWDDPRILTINGMRRRGYNADILNNFCDVVGVSRRGNENYIQFSVLENEVRKHYDLHAPRTMAVLEPVELLIEDLDQPEELTVPLFPKQQQKGSRKIRFTQRLYVELSDVRVQDEKGFYGIAPNKVVGLKYAHPLLIKEVRVEEGRIAGIVACLDKNKTKPSSYLNWLSADEAVDCEVRNFGLLFDLEKPGQADDFIKHLNPRSREVLPSAKVHRDIWNGLTTDSRFQFERKGYYCLDKDSDLGGKKLVWNQIAGLVDRAKK